jgi:hypothetical protein
MSAGIAEYGISSIDRISILLWEALAKISFRSWLCIINYKKKIKLSTGTLYQDLSGFFTIFRAFNKFYLLWYYRVEYDMTLKTEQPKKQGSSAETPIHETVLRAYKNTKDLTIPRRLNRKRLTFLVFFVLISVYLFTIVKIRSIYGEPSILFAENKNLPVSENFERFVDSSGSDASAGISDNAHESIYITDNQIFLLTSTAKPTNTPTKAPTQKPNTPTPLPTSTITVLITAKPPPTNTPTEFPHTPIPEPTVVQSPVIDFSKPWEVAPGCPATTQKCVPCVTGEAYCRIEPGKINGFKGWACQNNNPGNIRPASFKNDLIRNNGGIPPCGERSGYMVFRDYETGKNGLKAYLRAISNGQHSSYRELNPDGSIKINCGECSLQFFFNKYAPAGDQNDPGSYANYVAGRIGVDSGTTMLSWIVANKLDAFADAIQTHEGWFAN